MNSKRCNVLGVLFNSVTRVEAIDWVVTALQNEKICSVTTANPEIVMLARQNADFLTLVNQSDLIVADGIGVVYGSKILKKPLPERVAGYDLVQGVFDRIKNQPVRVYFLGAKDGVAQAAADAMRIKHPGLEIVGVHHGYFSKSEDARIASVIKALDVDLLLVGLGAPRQEQWAMAYKDEIGAKVVIGVGGSFDAMSGLVKRAPDIWIRFHLEWFYRLLKQPTRFKRMLQLPLFLVYVMRQRSREKRS